MKGALVEPTPSPKTHVCGKISCWRGVAWLVNVYLDRCGMDGERSIDTRMQGDGNCGHDDNGDGSGCNCDGVHDSINVYSILVLVVGVARNDDRRCNSSYVRGCRGACPAVVCQWWLGWHIQWWLEWQ